LPVGGRLLTAAAPELELFTHRVRDVVPGAATRLRGDGVLTVDLDEVREVALDPEHFADVRVEIARPGEPARIVHAIDAVEPRVRVDEPGGDFPGMLGRPRTVGSGRTVRLDGVCVMETAAALPGEPNYWRETIVEMDGPGARYTPFGALTNVVLSFEPNPRLVQEGAQPLNVFEGTPETAAFNRAVRAAGLRAAVRLAEAAGDREPDEVERLSLAPLPAGDLPAVVYAYQLNAPYVYGALVPSEGALGGRAHLPTAIHPNEILDGAIVNGWNAVPCMREATYLVQNHALVRELYTRHGRDLDFRGVVLMGNGDSIESKHRVTSYAAKLVHLLGADAAVLNYLGGGNPLMDVMMLCQQLEESGVRTVLLVPEMARDPREPGLMHSVREADAIVSTGNYEETIELPAVERVIGGRSIPGADDAAGPLERPLSELFASTNPFGHLMLRGAEQ
jgi:glycine reductase complex component B subunit alpha and beta